MDTKLPTAQAVTTAAEHWQAGRCDAAEADCLAVLSREPRQPRCLHLLGKILQARGKLPEAMRSYQQSLMAKQDEPEVFHDLGTVIKLQGWIDQAIIGFREAIRLKPDYAEAHASLGEALRAKGMVEEALVSIRRALDLRPGEAEFQRHLGDALQDAGALERAITAYKRALELKPDLIQAQSSLQAALQAERQTDESIGMYRRILSIEPDNAEALNNLGNLLKNTGEIEEAKACIRRAMALKPDNAGFHSNLILTLQYDPMSTRASLYEEACQWAKRHAKVPAMGAPARDRDPDRRLRVGYVSGDFRQHPSAFFLLPMLKCHNRARVDIICYSEGPPDILTRRFQELAGAWRNTAGVPDDRVAEGIREDGIDILVDLSVHSGLNRLPVFARKPAPVQVTWLGYPGTTGVGAIDYRLTDRFLDPPSVLSPPASPAADPLPSIAAEDSQTFSGEKLIYLPECYWSYAPLAALPETNALPADSQGRVTFGCLNHFPKASDPALHLWAALLAAIPDSRLVLHSPPGAHRRRVRDIFAAHDVSEERVELVARVPLKQYQGLYHGIDIALDPFPFAGGTTTFDALLMGVPVITLRGATAVGRGGVSILSNLGIPELVAENEKDYQKKACDLSADRGRLREYRTTLRARMQSSPLMDGPRFAQHVEEAYRRMWVTWCTGQSCS